LNEAVKASGAELGTPRPTGRPGLKTSYALSLWWIALSLVAAVTSAIFTNIIFSDFVHGNPNRTTADSILTVVTMSPIMGLLGIIGCFLVFSLPQAAQAAVHMLARRLSRPFAQLFVLSSIPLLAAMTWYCWEYLTPSDFAGGDDPDWKPYQHGITTQRYLAALAYQVPISIFSIVCFEPDLLGTTRKTIRLVVIGCAVLAGAWYGHAMAVADHAKP
jgi:hypothetical protein